MSFMTGKLKVRGDLGFAAQIPGPVPDPLGGRLRRPWRRRPASAPYAPRLPPAERREQLLDAALELIVERGYDGRLDGGGRAGRRRDQARRLRQLRQPRTSCCARCSSARSQRALAQLDAVMPADPVGRSRRARRRGLRRLPAVGRGQPDHLAADRDARRGHARRGSRARRGRPRDDPRPARGTARLGRRGARRPARARSSSSPPGA